MQFLFLFKENFNLHIEQEKVVLLVFRKLIISFFVESSGITIAR